jgi:predicted nucleotidyltransferase
MNRREAITKLKSDAEAVKALGATSLYLFGSVARDEAETRSDLDLFIDYDPEGKFSLLELVGIKLLLEQRLGVRVDVTTRDVCTPCCAPTSSNRRYACSDGAQRPVLQDILTEIQGIEAAITYNLLAATPHAPAPAARRATVSLVAANSPIKARSTAALRVGEEIFAPIRSVT